MNRASEFSYFKITHRSRITIFLVSLFISHLLSASNFWFSSNKSLHLKCEIQYNSQRTKLTTVEDVVLTPEKPAHLKYGTFVVDGHYLKDINLDDQKSVPNQKIPIGEIILWSNNESIIEASSYLYLQPYESSVSFLNEKTKESLTALCMGYLDQSQKDYEN